MTETDHVNQPLANTPRYVLLDGKERAGPSLVANQEKATCLAIYGFSDKEPYDLFRDSSTRALTPYPLVRGYLQDQITCSTIDHLIILDAASPSEKHLRAATMQSVLEAQISEASQVAVSHLLTLDPLTQSYLVEEASPSMLKPTGETDVVATSRKV